MVKSVGISASRYRLPVEQERAFYWTVVGFIREGATEVHHGACTGGDEFIHNALAGRFQVWLHVHPPVDKKFSAEASLKSDIRMVMHEAKVYAVRNQDIVDLADVLVAAPQYPEDHCKSARSGTWQAVRKADAAGKLVLIIEANGEVHPYERKPATER